MRNANLGMNFLRAGIAPISNFIHLSFILIVRHLWILLAIVGTSRSAVGCTSEEINYLLRIIQFYNCSLSEQDTTIICVRSPEQSEIQIPLGATTLDIGAYQLQFNCKLGSCITQRTPTYSSEPGYRGRYTQAWRSQYTSYVIFWATATNDATVRALDTCFNGPRPGPVNPWPNRTPPAPGPGRPSTSYTNPQIE
jgi:hypothetical protein